MDFETPLVGPAPHLFSLPMAASRHGLPDGYHAAQATFTEATDDFKAGKHASAAKLFLEVAELLKAPAPRTTYSDQFAEMRDAAYRDAAIAFELAEDDEGARAALTAALKKDPESADVLKQLLAGL